MAAFAFLFIVSLAILCPVVGAEEFGIALEQIWLHADGSQAWETYEEGDTAVVHCVGRETIHNAPFDFVEIQWLKPGGDEWVTIADHENIVYNDRNRFSQPNLTVNSQNETEYTMAISPIDRYDGGTPPRFGCEFGVQGDNLSFRRRTARELDIKWVPPSATCSSSITPDTKAEKGDDVSRYCTVTDVDRLSTGSVTLWNGDVKLAADQTKIPLTPGYEYNISYANTVTDDTANYVYMCRYSASGGFQEYGSNCTFNRPLCVVEDLADPCPTSSPPSSSPPSTSPSSSTEPRRFMMSSIYMGILTMVSSRII